MKNKTEFVFTKDKIKSGNISLVTDKDCMSGAIRVSSWLRDDMKDVFGYRPRIKFTSNIHNLRNDIVFGIYGHSKIINEISQAYNIDFSSLKGKRECYIRAVIHKTKSESDEDAIYIIAGSDKRGLIYGLLNLDLMFTKSPFYHWLSVPVSHLESLSVKESFFESREPSVKYRGFFINDEWPAFGNWCNKKFGGFNAKCYEKIFELLLRLKGNYLWPAMWSARFSCDGPGLKIAQLADELGVIIGSSHHEPCNRNGEEYKYERGPSSPYGDAWNFRTNKEGITRFWRDGLLRNKYFETVITLGMRGEADSTILGKEATLSDNIELLKDVLKCQNNLIKECINPDLSKVHRMIALYKEVEPFFYGNDDVKGLKDSDLLDDVILMLCDDNFGNLRTIPSNDIRDHKGGFGLYYHFDYHGWPVSYEWINTTQLIKVFEQMKAAYEYNIRELWIVNVGDIFTNELPLLLFMELGFDIDKYGDICTPEVLHEQFVSGLFGDKISQSLKKKMIKFLMDYTKMAAERRNESTDEFSFSPYPGDAAECELKKSIKLMDSCESVYNSLDEDLKDVFFESFYYPVMGTANVRKMWCAASVNKYLAQIGAAKSEYYADLIREAIEFDKQLVERIHSFNNGKWFGMSLSSHIGFIHWNDEECRYPVIHSVYPSEKKRGLVTGKMLDYYSEGGDWTGKDIILNDFVNPKVTESFIRIYNESLIPLHYFITDISKGLIIRNVKGSVKGGGSTDIHITADRKKLSDNSFFYVCLPCGKVKVIINSSRLDTNAVNNYNCFIEPDSYSDSHTEGVGQFVILKDYGPIKNAVKYLTKQNVFEDSEKDLRVPYLDYDFNALCDGDYYLYIYSSPSNPPFLDNKISVGVKVNEEKCNIINMVSDDFKVSDDNEEWKDGVLYNRHVKRISVSLKKGSNKIRLYFMSSVFVLLGLKIEMKES